MSTGRYHLSDASRRSRWPTPREWIAGLSAAAGAAAAALVSGQSPAVVACWAIGAGAAVVGGMKGR